MVRLRKINIPIIIFRSLYFKKVANAKIVHRSGRLLLGKRWDNSRYMPSELKICANGILEINGDMTVFTACAIDICENAKLVFGSGYINRGVRIVAFNLIKIGQNVAISENVTLRDSDNHSIVGSDSAITAPIVIGDNVWIGINVTILKGVNVGDGAVIAANSLVNKDVPANTLVAGVPARVIKENITWQ